MTENKQTAVEWLALQLYEKMQMKGDGNIFDDILNKALQMEREQMEEFLKRFLLWSGESQESMENLLDDYYTDTYGE